MEDFGYAARGREVTEALAAVSAAFNAVVDRYDENDLRTRRWRAAIDAFHAACARVYPEPLQQVDRGLKHASDIDTAVMLDFLEADPFFYRSGYMKEKILTEFKRRQLDRHEVARLQAIILRVVVTQDHRREFRYYCRAAANVDDRKFRAKLAALEGSRSTKISLRANWVLAALDDKWLDLKRATRGYERKADSYDRVKNPRIR